MVAIDTRKALALLAYLIVGGEPKSHDTAAALLWPESDQTFARAALRRTLSSLSRVFNEDVFDFGREVITLKPSGGLPTLLYWTTCHLALHMSNGSFGIDDPGSTRIESPRLVPALAGGPATGSWQGKPCQGTSCRAND